TWSSWQWLSISHSILQVPKPSSIEHRDSRGSPGSCARPAKMHSRSVRQPTYLHVPSSHSLNAGHSASPLQGVTQKPWRHSSKSSSRSASVRQSASEAHSAQEREPCSFISQSGVVGGQSVSSSQLLSKTHSSFVQTRVQILSQSGSEQIGSRGS